MHLNGDEFKKIQSKNKTTEVRIFDEKRKQIALDTEIIYHNRDSSSEEIHVRVVGLSKFKSFKDLYASIAKSKVGYDANESLEKQLKDIYRFYDHREEELNGVLGIHFEII